MLMPPEAFSEELAEIWVEQMQFREEAECTVAHLFARLPYASGLAFTWIARREPMFRLCGYLLFSRLFMKGAQPAPRDARELLDQIQAELQQPDPLVARAAHTVLLRYMDFGDEEARQGEALLEACGL